MTLTVSVSWLVAFWVSSDILACGGTGGTCAESVVKLDGRWGRGKGWAGERTEQLDPKRSRVGWTSWEKRGSGVERKRERGEAER